MRTRQLYFDLATEQLSTKRPSSSTAQDEMPTTQMVLGSDEGRRHVYRLTGPRSRVLARSSFSESELASGHVSGVTVAPIAPDHAFIEADVLYRDADLLVLLSQDLLGDGAHRMITAVSATGVRWTVPEGQLLKRMRYDGSNAFNKMFFIKGDIHAVRDGDTLAVTMDKDGVMGIDLPTGALKLSIEP